MPASTVLATLLALLIVGWAIWFIIGLVRYIRSGDYDIDRRLQKISQ